MQYLGRQRLTKKKSFFFILERRVPFCKKKILNNYGLYYKELRKVNRFEDYVYMYIHLYIYTFTRAGVYFTTLNFQRQSAKLSNGSDWT